MRTLSPQMTRSTRTTRDPARHLLILAKEMARPVARGLLPLPHADATLLAFAIKASREGRLEFEPVQFARICCHILRLWRRNHAASRDTAAGRIRRSVDRLIEIREPSSVIRQAAHDLNSNAVLRNYEVERLIKIAMIQAMEDNSYA
jgi:hypothetical protein